MIVPPGSALACAEHKAERRARQRDHGWASRPVANPMDDDFVAPRIVEDQVGVRVDDDAAKARHARKLAGLRMRGDEVDHRLNARPYVTRALRRASFDIRKDLIEFLGGATRISKLHRPCLAQDGPYLVVGRELTALSLQQRGFERLFLLRAEPHDRRVARLSIAGECGQAHPAFRAAARARFRRLAPEARSRTSSSPFDRKFEWPCQTRRRKADS